MAMHEPIPGAPCVKWRKGLFSIPTTHDTFYIFSHSHKNTGRCGPP